MIQTSLFTFTIRRRIKISPTSTGQKKAVSIIFLTLSSRLATTRRDLASNSDKKPKNRKKFAKKIRLKNREIRKNRIKLLLFTFENRWKIKEKSALFGGPYRNSHRQFFYCPAVLLAGLAAGLLKVANGLATLSKWSRTPYYALLRVGMRSNARWRAS